MRGTGGALETFHIFICMLITEIYACENRRTALLLLVHIMHCLSLNKNKELRVKPSDKKERKCGAGGAGWK